MHVYESIVIAAMALAVLIKGLFSGLKSPRAARFLSSCGGCAFGIYLLQDWLIAQSELRVFLPLCNMLPAFPAVVIWEVLLFLTALLAVWLVRLIPGVKKLI